MLSCAQLDKIEKIYYYSKQNCVWCNKTGRGVATYIIDGSWGVVCCNVCCKKQYKNLIIKKLSTKDLFYLKLTHKEFA